jgi:23S rRNA (uracil1939-C5)-methyltransferase
VGLWETERAAVGAERRREGRNLETPRRKPTVGGRSAAAGFQVPCPHFPDCVGCALIGTPYGEQLRRKRERLVQAFAGHPTLSALAVPELVKSPRAFGYRNQAKLVVRRARRGLLLGIYRPGSHQVVDIRHCPVHHVLIARALAAVAGLVERLAIEPYDERTGTGVLRYVVVRVSTWAKRAQVILVTSRRHLPRGRDLARALRRVAGVVSVVQNVNPTPGNVIFGPEFVPLAGDSALVERIGSLGLRTSAGAFLQANTSVARRLYQRALEWAAPGAADTAVDLYCGAGAMTFCLATAARHVIGVEESAIAVADAKANVRLNGFANTRFECGAAAEVLPELAQRLGRIDVLTLNPPRKGADEATRRAIVACAPRRAVYISCAPDTLARDLDWLAHHGYRTTRVQAFDMLPQTEHVECVAELERCPPACGG